MIKYYCDICGLEVAPEENKNKLEIRLVKRGRLKSESEEIHFCDKCGKRLNQAKTGLTKTQIRGLLKRHGVSVRESLDKARKEKQFLTRPCRLCSTVKNKDSCQCPVWEAWFRHEWNDVCARLRNI